ncbi:MAG: hypothetical protein GX803_03855 [Lentisphaerae bacterium]|nr:hypothetical protein [Lentisphaerota bacterium]
MKIAPKTAKITQSGSRRLSPRLAPAPDLPARFATKIRDLRSGSDTAP